VARRTLALALAAVLPVVGCTFSPDEPDEPSTAVFCEDHATIEANFAALPNGSLAELKEGVALLASDAEGLAGRAPDAVAADAEALAAGLRQVSTAVAEATTVEEAEAAVAAVVDEPSYREASDAVTSWTVDNCEDE
jgi:hypothetical protein